MKTSNSINRYFIKAVIFLITVCLVAFFVPLFSVAHAQQAQIDYGDQIITDLDLDGLTDEGEKQIFKTDPLNPDTDGDGYLDGTEVVNDTDPLDAGDPLAKEITVVANQAVEPSWGWYVTRAAGLVGFLLLAISIFLGAGIGVPGLRKWLAAFYGAKVHCWISLQALLFALIHGLALLFDKYMGFGLKDIFIPLAARFNPGMVALGTIGFYIMLVIVVSSYLRKKISLPNHILKHCKCKEVCSILRTLCIVLFCFLILEINKLNFFLLLQT